MSMKGYDVFRVMDIVENLIKEKLKVEVHAELYSFDDWDVSVQLKWDGEIIDRSESNDSIY